MSLRIEQDWPALLILGLFAMFFIYIIILGYKQKKGDKKTGKQETKKD